jgi:MFS family permease
MLREMVEAPRSYLQVLRLAHVSNLLVAACLSRLAGRMFTLAIVLYVLSRFQSPSLAGWVSFAAMVPGMIVSSLAGALLDRVGMARAIAIDMAASALLLAGLTALHAMDVVSPALLLVLVAFYAVTSPLGAAGIRTLIPRMVPPQAGDQANALDTSSYALVDVLGPVLAGLLFGFAGAGTTLLVIVTLYVAAALSLVPLIRREPVRATAARPLMHEAMAGLAYVSATRRCVGWPSRIHCIR